MFDEKRPISRRTPGAQLVPETEFNCPVLQQGLRHDKRCPASDGQTGGEQVMPEKPVNCGG